MSRFFSGKYAALTPYTPGEQPKDQGYLKLNTNESPYPPSPRAQIYAREATENLNLYSDPTCAKLNARMAQVLGVEPDEILFTNGSDDILNFAFMAFCDEKTGAAFPDITYGFYPVFARLNGVDYKEIPLAGDFSIRIEDYLGLKKTIFIANPNAPTGKALTLPEIELILRSNPNNVVIIDEAYVDFGAKSAVSLIHKYENLLVTQTFSKSRSMAGARLGFGVGCKELIRDLNTLKFSTNPYNINAMTMAAGIGSLEDGAYFRANCAVIMETRAWTTAELRRLGFEVLDSMANFVFAKHPGIPGGRLYQELRNRGVLVRHFDGPRLADYNRITIGSDEQMTEFIRILTGILEETL